MIAGRITPRTAGEGLLWAAFLVLLVYFLIESIAYRFVEPGRLGPSLFNKALWYYLHAVLAIPALALAPLQFSTRLRTRRPRVHRTIGKTYVYCALGAAVISAGLGATHENPGMRIPLVLLSTIWFAFTAMAWITAVRRDFAAHRLFMMRSFNAALAFVWIRLLGMIPNDVLLPFIESRELASATREWITDVVPLLLLEFWIAWWPLVRQSGRHEPR